RGIEQVVEDGYLVAGRRTARDVASAQRLERRRGNKGEEDLDAAKEIKMVVRQPTGLRRGHAIDKFERADASLDRIGRHDLVGDRGVVVGCAHRRPTLCCGYVTCS